MTTNIDTRIEPTILDEVAISDASFDEVHLDDVSAETLSALKDFGTANAGEEHPADEIDLEIDQDAQIELSNQEETVVVESSSVPEIDFVLDPDFLAEDEAKPDLGETVIDVQNDLFGTANNAQGFLDDKLSMTELVNRLAQASAKQQEEGVDAGVNQNQNTQTSPEMSQHPMQQAQVLQPQGQVADDRVRMSLGSASMLLGAKGISGLGSMLNSGGRLVNSAISDFTFSRVERELNETITSARGQLTELKIGGLSVLEDEAMDKTAKAALLKQYLATPENNAKFENLISKVDRMNELSGKLIAKGLDKNMDGDAVMNRAIDPIHRFMKDNEKLLKNLPTGDTTLHEKLEGAVNTLFELLRDLLVHITSLFKGPPGEAKPAGPRMG